MKGIGIALAIGGFVVAGAALGMDTTASTGAAGFGPSEVYNLGRLQAQALTFVAGCTLFVAGVAIASAGAMIASIHRRIDLLERRRGPDAPPRNAEPLGEAPSATSPPRRVLTDEERAERDATIAAEARRTDRVTMTILGGLAVLFAIVIAIVYATGGFTTSLGADSGNAQQVEQNAGTGAAGNGAEENSLSAAR